MSGFREKSAVFLLEHLVGELAHPDADEDRRGRDHPCGPARVGRVQADEQEAEGENGEERSEGPATHPGTMPPRRGP
jgi:hypothetical protein